MQPSCTAQEYLYGFPLCPNGKLHYKCGFILWPCRNPWWGGHYFADWQQKNLTQYSCSYTCMLKIVHYVSIYIQTWVIIYYLKIIHRNSRTIIGKFISILVYLFSLTLFCTMSSTLSILPWFSRSKHCNHPPSLWNPIDIICVKDSSILGSKIAKMIKYCWTC